MKKLLMIFLLLGIVFISGCTNDGNSGGGAPSISISQFGPIGFGTQENPVISGKNLDLMAVFSNDGGADLKSAPTIKLSGLSSTWINENERVKIEDVNKLKSGQKKTVRWNLHSPVTSGYELDVQQYPVEVTFTFGYGTVFIGQFSWMSSEEYYNLLESSDQQTADQALSSKGLNVQTTSKGPITIDLVAEEVFDTPTVKLKLRNDGNGRVGGNGRIKFLSVEGLTCDDTGESEGILLWEKEFETYCDVKVGSNSDVASQIKVEILYDYTVSQETTIFYKDRGKDRGS